jgi:phosphoribosylaminoimidazole-succinocarboxamide synthase
VSLAQTLSAQLPHTLQRTTFEGLGTRYEGKVRDTYRQGEQLIIVTTDRLSAFDRVLTTLPFKGDVLNTLSGFWFEQTRSVCPNHVISRPDPCVTVARLTTPFAIEVVVRGYLTGSLWRDYLAGNDPYGLSLPKGLSKDSRFSTPLITPSTKAPKGEHDAPLTERDVVTRHLASPAQWALLRQRALALFAAGTRIAAERGLLLVDTKYEFGQVSDEVLLIDEVHTPDSSRFWVAEGSAERQAKGETQVMLDKENLRQWLLNERGFSGHGEPPSIPDDVRVSLTEKYMSAFARITGSSFEPQAGPTEARVRLNLQSAGLLR